MCIESRHYRGCADRPGLVLGLDHGGSCVGLAFRIAPDRIAEVCAALDARELISGVYRRRQLNVRLADGSRAQAHGYVADAGHAQYVRHRDPEKIVAMIRQGRGTAGTARDYLANTVGHLRALGIRDRRLEALLVAVDGGPAADLAAEAVIPR